MIKYLSKVACCLSVSFLVFSGISYAQQAAPKTIISGTLKVAVYNDFAPFAEKGAGLDVDIAAALAKKMALQLSVLPFNAGDDVGDDLRNMVWKGHYLGYGPADVMMHVPVDASLANRNDKVTIFAPYLRESVRVVRDVVGARGRRGRDGQRRDDRDDRDDAQEQKAVRVARLGGLPGVQQ